MPGRQHELLQSGGPPEHDCAKNSGRKFLQETRAIPLHLELLCIS